MNSSRIYRTALVLLALLSLGAAGAVAGDEPACMSKRSESISIEVDGDEFIVTSRCDGEEQVVMVNMDAIGTLVEDALADVSVVLEELDEMQLKIHLGEDNLLSFADAETEWEVDLEQIAHQVAAALEAGFGEFETGEWSHRRDRHDAEGELDELHRELDSLRQELKRLEQELEKETGRDRG
jgi:hypothetical protein